MILVPVYLISLDVSMPSSHGITCQIKVNGRVCEEYDTANALECINPGPSTTICRYVQLEADCTFELAYHIDSTSPDLTSISNNEHNDPLVPDGLKMKVTVDGRYIKTHISKLTSGSISGRRHLKDGAWDRRLLVTAKLETSEQSETAMDHLHRGSIEIVCRRITNLQFSDTVNDMQACDAFEGWADVPVDEKSLKGRYLEVSAGLSEVQQPTIPRRTTVYLPVDEVPFFTFVFRYRSRSKIVFWVEPIMLGALERIGILAPLREPVLEDLTADNLHDAECEQGRRDIKHDQQGSETPRKQKCRKIKPSSCVDRSPVPKRSWT